MVSNCDMLHLPVGSEAVLNKNNPSLLYSGDSGDIRNNIYFDTLDQKNILYVVCDPMLDGQNVISPFDYSTQHIEHCYVDIFGDDSGHYGDNLFIKYKGSDPSSHNTYIIHCYFLNINSVTPDADGKVNLDP